VYASFKFNQDYIAQNLCVENDIENSTCKGCCHLKKKVNEQQEQKRDLPSVQNDKQNLNYCEQSTELNLILNSSFSLLPGRNPTEYTFSRYHSIFHPPELMI